MSVDGYPGYRIPTPLLAMTLKVHCMGAGGLPERKPNCPMLSQEPQLLFTRLYVRAGAPEVWNR